MAETETQFVADTGNFGGAARAIPATGGQGNRAQAVADLIQNVRGVRDDAINNLPLIMALQEMTKIQSVEGRSSVSPVDYPLEIDRCLHRVGVPADYYAVPTVTMTQYPLGEKWNDRWAEGIVEMEQGMCTFAAKGARLQAPWLEAPRDAQHKGWRLDLPSHKIGLSTYYQGNRDTEPRAATAHGVNLPNTTGSRFIFVNVHLATLRSEDEKKWLPEDGVERTVRRPCPDARALRELQLGVIRDFITAVAYERLQLPVIVAGDFNASPDEPELTKFMGSAYLKPVFHSGTCWKCGGPRAATQYFTSPDDKGILAETEAEVIALGSTPVPISTDAHCPTCRVPLFTHKRNFGLIDNILYTDADAPRVKAWAVQGRLEPDTNARGIRLDTYFSDHLPLWCKFRVT